LIFYWKDFPSEGEPNEVSVSKPPVAARDRMERSDHEAIRPPGLPGCDATARSLYLYHHSRIFYDPY
jgi:hypothetical protein